MNNILNILCIFKEEVLSGLIQDYILGPIDKTAQLWYIKRYLCFSVQKKKGEI